MSEIPFEENTLEFTMLIPFYSRAVRTLCANSDFKDYTATDIFNKLKYDFEKIKKNYDEAAHVCIEARTKALDYLIKKFIEKKPYATIVNLGAGLDTPFNRVDNGKVKWYDLDLPDAIELRRKFIRETDRNRFIAKSMFDYDWFNEIEYTPEKGILFVASGVLMYFSENKVKSFLKKIAGHFPGGELVFDAVTSKIAALVANLRMRKCGNSKAMVKWYIKNSKIFSLWDKRIVLLKIMNYFDRIKNRLIASKITKIKLFISQIINAMKYYHLKFLDGGELTPTPIERNP
ncbi:MAG: class I SAM-dependent methyltransferase [Candidatus Odinarchaeum yellowstonii]|uniref:Class I SAM-dependent methyltransferase n=1 Tax=Odinarchaeota yellowstonii (strain LCB_4) TaxID=1841599 RepID=A0AAF0D3G2_ODILC|nr:MAG: class I SAM-dependent methyltransferase [Candidatus Odinarchaeum yellowstonii]